MSADDRPIASSASSEWIDALADDGYLVARAVLDHEGVEQLRAAFAASQPGATLHVEIDDDTPHAERWRTLVEEPDVARLLRGTLEECEVRIHGRDPGRGGGAQGLHADRPPGRAHAIDALTLIWMLDEFTEANGATRVVPKSHRGAAPVPRQLAQPGVGHPDEIVILGDAGDVLIFDGHLWHSGRENTTDQRRRIVQMTATRTSLVV